MRGGSPRRRSCSSWAWPGRSPRALTDGPDIAFHDGTYVLFYSGGGCCRPPCHYSVGVASAPSILGPCTKDPANPIFHGGNGWKCPGHGTLVTAPDGSLTFLHHAYRADDAPDIDREVLLEPVTWQDDGWPAIGVDGAPVAAATPTDAGSFADGFAGRTLALGWAWPFWSPPKVKLARGVLTIASGRITRTWTPRQFVEVASVRAPSTPGLQLDTGRSVTVQRVADLPALPGPPKPPPPPKGTKPKPKKPVPGAVLSSGGVPIATVRLANIERLRISVRGGTAFAASVWAPRSGGWHRVGPVVLAPAFTRVDRVTLGPGAYDDVVVRRPLGR